MKKILLLLALVVSLQSYSKDLCPLKQGKTLKGYKSLYSITCDAYSQLNTSGTFTVNIKAAYTSFYSTLTTLFPNASGIVTYESTDGSQVEIVCTQRPKKGSGYAHVYANGVLVETHYINVTNVSFFTDITSNPLGSIGIVIDQTP